MPNGIGAGAASQPGIVRPRRRARAPRSSTGREVLRRKIVDAIGREEVTRAVDKYVRDFPLPEDFEVLEQALEHRSRDRVAEVLSMLVALLARETPKRTRVLVAKLRLVEETADEPSLREAARKVLDLVS